MQPQADPDASRATSTTQPAVGLLKYLSHGLVFHRACRMATD